MLHAAELGFVHPASGLELSFTSPLPADMRRLRERLRNPPRGPRGSRPAGTRGGMNAAETPGGLIAGANDEHYDDGGDADADHDTDD
jgi:hypothetical protein